MSLFRPALAAALLAAASIQPALARTPVEGFDQIETRYQEADRLPAAQSQLAAALPAGMATATAREIVADAGAKCKDGRDPARVKCSFAKVYDDFSRSVFVRWDVYLVSNGAQIESVTVNRLSDATNY